MILTLVEIFRDSPHETLIVRARRALLFAFGFCYACSQTLASLGSMTPACDREYRDGDDDDGAAQDDFVMSNNCSGTSSAVFFYSMALFGALIGVLLSLRFDFPVDSAPLHRATGSDFSKLHNSSNAEHKVDYFAENPQYGKGGTVNHQGFPQNAAASTLFRFTSYFYQGEDDGDMTRETVDTSSSAFLSSNTHSLSRSLLRA